MLGDQVRRVSRPGQAGPPRERTRYPRFAMVRTIASSRWAKRASGRA